jgi:hypothetical protein
LILNFYEKFLKTGEAEKVRQKILGLENQTVEKTAERFPDFKKRYF